MRLMLSMLIQVVSAIAAEPNASTRAHYDLMKARHRRLVQDASAWRMAGKIEDEIKRIEREYGWSAAKARQDDHTSGGWAKRASSGVVRDVAWRERYDRSYVHATAAAEADGLFFPPEAADEFATYQADAYVDDPRNLGRWIENYRRVFGALRRSFGPNPDAHDIEAARTDGIRLATRHDAPASWAERFNLAFTVMRAPFAERGMQFSDVEARVWAKEQADNYPMTSHLVHWIGRYQTAFDFVRTPVSMAGLGLVDPIEQRTRAIEFAQRFVLDDHLAEWIKRYRMALEFMKGPRAEGGLGIPEEDAARWASERAEADHNRENLRDWIARVKLGRTFARTPIADLGGGLEHDEDGAVGWGLALATRFWNKDHLEDYVKRYRRALAFARAPLGEQGLSLADPDTKAWACRMIDRHDRMSFLRDWIDRYRLAYRFMNDPIERGGTGLGPKEASVWAIEVADANHSDRPLREWIGHYRTAFDIAKTNVGKGERFATEWDARNWALDRAHVHGEHYAWYRWLKSHEVRWLSASHVMEITRPDRAAHSHRRVSFRERCANFLSDLLRR